MKTLWKLIIALVASCWRTEVATIILLNTADVDTV